MVSVLLTTPVWASVYFTLIPYGRVPTNPCCKLSRLIYHYIFHLNSCTLALNAIRWILTNSPWVTVFNSIGSFCHSEATWSSSISLPCPSIKPIHPKTQRCISRINLLCYFINKLDWLIKPISTLMKPFFLICFLSDRESQIEKKDLQNIFMI